MLKRIFTQSSSLLVAFILLCQPHLAAELHAFSTVGNVYSSSKSVVGSQVTGRVDHLYADIGQEVEKDQPIAVLDPVFFELDFSKKNHMLESAKIELMDAETHFFRMQRLWEKENGQAPSVSLKKYEEAKSRYDQAVIQFKQSEEEVQRAQVTLDETIVRAPFAGVITKKFIDVGESVSSVTATPIVEIQSLSPVYLEFSIPQNYLNNIHVGVPIAFSIEGTGGVEHTAKVDLVYPCIDEATRSLKCRAVLSNHDKKILPGSFAKIIIKGDAL